jgi:hypothetical protein
MHAVEFQQMRVGLHWAEIVDRHDLDIGAAGFDKATQGVAADAPESVDGQFECHDSLLRQFKTMWSGIGPE